MLLGISWSQPAERHHDSCHGVDVIAIPREGTIPSEVGLRLHVQLSRALGAGEKLKVGRPWAVTNPWGTGWATAQHEPEGPGCHPGDRFGSCLLKGRCPAPTAAALAGLRPFATLTQTAASGSDSTPAAVCYEFEVYARAGDWLAVTVFVGAQGIPAGDRLFIFEWDDRTSPAANGTTAAGLPPGGPALEMVTLAHGGCGGGGGGCTCLIGGSSPVQPRHGCGCPPCGGALFGVAAGAAAEALAPEPGASQEQLAARARKELGSLEAMVRRLGLQASEALSGQSLFQGWQHLRDAFDAEITQALAEVSNVAEVAGSQAVQTLADALGGAAASAADAGARAGGSAVAAVKPRAQTAMPLLKEMQTVLSKLGVLLSHLVRTLETLSAGGLPDAVSLEGARAAAAAVPGLSAGRKVAAAVRGGAANGAQQLHRTVESWVLDFNDTLDRVAVRISSLAEAAEDLLEEAVELAAARLRKELVDTLGKRLRALVSDALDRLLSEIGQSEAGKAFASALRVADAAIREQGGAKSDGGAKVLKDLMEKEAGILAKAVAQRVLLTGGGSSVAAQWLQRRLSGLASGAQSAGSSSDMAPLAVSRF